VFIQKEEHQVRTTNMLLVRDQKLNTTHNFSSSVAVLDRLLVGKKKRAVVSCPTQPCQSNSTVPWSLEWLSYIPNKDVMVRSCFNANEYVSIFCSLEISYSTSASTQTGDEEKVHNSS